MRHSDSRDQPRISAAMTAEIEAQKAAYTTAFERETAYLNRLAHRLLRYTGTRWSCAEDLVAEAYVRGFRALQKSGFLSMPAGQQRSYLRSTIVRIYIDWLRRIKVRLESVEEQKSRSRQPFDPERQFVLNRFMGIALSRLTDFQRRIYKTKFGTGTKILSTKRVADRLHSTPATISYQLSLARRKIRHTMLRLIGACDAMPGLSYDTRVYLFGLVEQVIDRKRRKKDSQNSEAAAS